MATSPRTRNVRSAATAQMGKTPEQEAELARLRAEKQARETKQATVVEQPHVVQMTMPEKMVRAMSSLAALFGEDDASADPAITGRRKLAAFFATIVLAGGAGYVIGQLAGYAMVGVFMLTGSALLSYLILIAAIMLACYAGIKIGQYVGNYVLSGQVDRDFAAAKERITGFFRREPALIAT